MTNLVSHTTSQPTFQTIKNDTDAKAFRKKIVAFTIDSTYYPKGYESEKYPLYGRVGTYHDLTGDHCRRMNEFMVLFFETSAAPQLDKTKLKAPAIFSDDPHLFLVTKTEGLCMREATSEELEELKKDTKLQKQHFAHLEEKS